MEHMDYAEAGKVMTGTSAMPEGAGKRSDSVPVWDPDSALNDLAERVDFIDTSNLPELADLHGAFEDFSSATVSLDYHAEIATVSGLACRDISSIILEECDDPIAVTVRLGDIIAYLQETVNAGAAPAIPPEWGEGTQDNRGNGSSGVVELKQADGLEADGFCDDPELLQEFFVEAREHLSEAEVQLLELESNPEDKDGIAAVFRAFHTVKGAAGFLKLERIQSLAHVAESLLDKVREGSVAMEGPVIDLSFKAIDGLKRLVEEEGGSAGADDTSWVDDLVAALEAATQRKSPTKRLGEILVDGGLSSTREVEDALEFQKGPEPQPKLAEVLVATGKLSAEDAVEALRKQKEQRRPTTQQRESIKVDADRLDLLVDLIGELVIAEAMARQSEEIGDDPMSPLSRRLGEIDKITRELQSISMSLRMVPVRGTFQKMARLVRDLARKFGKDVEFVTEGEDTELDKNVVDLVADPLMHMVRNALDHGIETAEERAASGKPPRAKLILRAYHEGGSVYVDIVDDGRGLNREAILKKAHERGLVKRGENPADSDVWNLVFQSGFSTAREVTDVSGRGVGMDVVQRNITALHGSIDIRSKAGEGSTFSIRLPLTLAIVDGMAICAGGERFIVPIGNVVRATRPEPGEVITVARKGEMLRQHDKLIPLFRLERIMDIPDAIDNPEEGIVLILEDGGNQIGLLADDLIGQQQVVIKPLGKSLGRVDGLAGGAIMPDGRVGLVVDTASLFQSARQEEGEVRGA